jgi:uncharacterized membrane protein
MGHAQRSHTATGVGPGASGSWLQRWASDSVTQAGIAGASWSVAGSLARSLLPRHPVQQAIATGATAAIHYELTATAWASMQAIAAKPGQRPSMRANMLVSAAGIAAGLGITTVANTVSSGSMSASAVSTAGRIVSFAALAGGAAAVWDGLLHQKKGMKPGLTTTVIPAIATGSAVVASSIITRHRRAQQYGIVEPTRRAVSGVTPVAAAKAAGIGLATGVGLAVSTAAEQLLAHQLERGMSWAIKRDTGALGAVVAHGIILTNLTLGAAFALSAVTAQIQRRDDIVEPAYPAPPSSAFVSCGPNSVMPFDSIGKEGRRFVLMALTDQEITAVMRQPAINPIRIVGGYESADSIPARVELMIEDMHRLGAFSREFIAVGSPTGVGYFNYSIAEALEYLTLGDCAIIVPQYALVPSALALTQTKKAEELTRLLLQRIRTEFQNIDSENSPPNEPQVLLIGESLGANVALDCAIDAADNPYVPIFDELGVSAGLYLGVPFRTKMWKAWRSERMLVDPHYQLELVSEPSEIGPRPKGKHRHLMVVHHDDPINKFGFTMVVQPPWWMGAPAERPPLVPRESKFRPFTTFILGTIDLFNGMQSRPGVFVRKAHDYRIDIRLGLERAFGFKSTPTQAEAIETALRERERQWATKRMVARKLDRARKSIEKQLAQWGGNPAIQLADLDPAQSQTDLPRPPRLSFGAISAPPGS